MRMTHGWLVWAGPVVLGSLVIASSAAAQEAAKSTITIPAQSFTAQGGGEVAKAEPQSPGSNAEYVHFWYTPGHWLEWSIAKAAAGDCEVTLCYAGKQDATRALTVNGQPIKALENFALPRTGRWDAWREIKLPAPVTLQAGSNILRLTCRDETSIRLSEVKFAAAGKEPITLKASQFTGQGGGQVQVLTPPTCGTVSKWAPKDHWLEWTVNVPAAGRYAAQLHYMSDGYTQLELRANGEKVPGLDAFILPYTGEDTHWTLGTLPVAVTLKQGPNTLRLMTLGGDTKNVPTINGVFGLSAIILTPTGSAQIAGPSVLQLLTAAELKRPRFEPKAISPAPLGPPLAASAGAVPLVEGGAFEVAGQKVTITKVDALPYVENKFSQRFEFENYDNPDLRRFREKYQLDQVIAPGRDEYEKQLLLMKWVWDQWDFGHGQERYDLQDPFEIVDQAKREHKFQCMHSGSVLLTAANSLGWVARPMAIPRHTFCEIWSNQYHKWVLFDATSNYTPQKNDQPLNTYEMRQALLREGGGVMRIKWGDTGLEKKAQNLSYGQRLLFIGYLANTNYLTCGGPRYDNGKFFITKDELCAGKTWHTRDCPDHPAVEPYFPINQAAVALVPEGDAVEVALGTMTPNFKEFQIRLDGREWRASAAFAWRLHSDENRLEARSVNKFLVSGPISTIVLTVTK